MAAISAAVTLAWLSHGAPSCSDWRGENSPVAVTLAWFVQGSVDRSHRVSKNRLTQHTSAVSCVVVEIFYLRWLHQLRQSFTVGTRNRNRHAL